MELEGEILSYPNVVAIPRRGRRYASDDDVLLVTSTFAIAGTVLTLFSTLTPDPRSESARTAHPVTLPV